MLLALRDGARLRAYDVARGAGVPYRGVHAVLWSLDEDGYAYVIGGVRRGGVTGQATARITRRGVEALVGLGFPPVGNGAT